MAMQKEDTIEKVFSIISEKLNIPKEQITLETTFKDLGADSLDEVELVMSFEEEFGITVKDEESEKIKTIKDAVDLIQKYRKR